MAKLKLTDELIAELCKYKKAGLTNKAVCDAAGISEPTFYDYLKRGEANVGAGKSTIFSKFFKSYKKAETQHKLLRLQQIAKAAEEGNWQAAAWELERCYPAEYGKRVAAELTGKDGEAIKTESALSGSVNVNASVNLSELSDEELNDLEKILDKIGKK